MSAPAVPRPEVGPPAAWAFPTAQRWRARSGMAVAAYDVPGQYVVSVRLAVPLLLTSEPEHLEGIATIMSRTLDEGTTQHGPEELAELMERLGMGFSSSVADSGLTLEVDVAKRRLPEALALLAEVVEGPLFPPAEVERQVRTRLAEIEQERAAPAQRAALEFLPTFFAPTERSSRPTGGRPETVAAITPEDLRAFHATWVGPVGATLVVAGDLSGVDVPAQVDAALGGWRPQSGEPGTGQAPMRAPDAERIVFVDRPGSVQTEIYLGCAGPDRHVPEGWAPFPVLGFVVGGSPTARIDAVLREEKGFTYGIRAGFRPRHRGGLFLTSGAVRADSTVEAVELVLDLLRSGLDGFTEEETRTGIDFIRMTAPSRYATADAVADEAATLALEGLTTEFTTANLLALESLDARQIGEAYRRYVTGRWTVVLVGDASLYADGIRGLGRGEVTVVPA